MITRNRNVNSYRYGFNGMERENEHTQGKYDFGARIYDSRLGRFLSVDRYQKDFAYQTPYLFAQNKPIIGIDVNGDFIEVVTTYSKETQEDRTEIEVATHELILTVKVLDLTTDNNKTANNLKGKNKKTSLAEDYAGALQEELNSLSGEYLKELGSDIDFDLDGKMTKHVFKIKATVEAVTDMSQVNEKDHLQVLVDDVKGKADPKGGGGEAVGLALDGGLISYVEISGGWSMGAFTETGIHELGHNLGQGHDFNSPGNYMSYGKKNHFTPNQWWDIKEQERNGHLNSGSNSEITEDWNWIDNGESSNEKPYIGLDSGDKIPKVVPNTTK